MRDTMKPSHFTRRNFLLTSATLFAGALATPYLARPAMAAAPKLKTVEDGYLTIAMSGNMPMTGYKDGKIMGSDAEMIVAIAQKLGLKPKAAVMSWSSTIQAIRSGRADVMCGNMGWSAKRAEAMLLTDAIYYTGNFITMRRSQPFKDHITVKELQGHSIGTGTGYSFVPDLKRIPDATVRLYDSADGCMRDILAGRIEFGVLDGPTVDYMLVKDPSLDVKQVPIVLDADYQQLTQKNFSVLGMNMENTDLFDAVNAGVKWLWKSKTNAEKLAKNGITSPYYMEPAKTDKRLGVDRDADDNVIGAGKHKTVDYSSYFA